jgi:2'-5' RNA ligase
MRLFVAVSLPSDVHDRLAALQDRLRAARADVSWVKRDNIHVTLKFLGETEEKRLERIRSALAEVAQASAPFSMDMAGVGSFGGRVPRVIWVGVTQGGEPLTQLAREVETAMARVGFPKEKRGFTGHLTLGRVRSPKNADALLSALTEAEAERFGAVEVRHFELIQSQLHPTGSVYTVVDTFPLGSTQTPLRQNPPSAPL